MLADHCDRRRLLLRLQMCMMAVALVVTVLAMTDRLTPMVLIVAGGLCVGAGAVTMAVAQVAAAAIADLFVMGGGQFLVLVIARTLLQMEAPPALHGRLIGVFLAPVLALGALAGYGWGWAADRFGVIATVRWATLYGVVLGVALAVGATSTRSRVAELGRTTAAQL